MTNLVISLWFLFGQGLIGNPGSEPWRCMGTDADFVIEKWTAGAPQPSVTELRTAYPDALAWWNSRLAAAETAQIAAIPAELTKAETDLAAIEKTPLSAENGKLAAALLLILRELHPELVAAKEAVKEIEPR